MTGESCGIDSPFLFINIIKNIKMHIKIADLAKLDHSFGVDQESDEPYVTISGPKHLVDKMELIDYYLIKILNISNYEYIKNSLWEEDKEDQIISKRYWI